MLAQEGLLNMQKVRSAGKLQHNCTLVCVLPGQCSTLAWQAAVRGSTSCGCLMLLLTMSSVM